MDATAVEGRGRATGPALATVCVILFLTFLDTTIVSVALASIQSGLHAGVVSLQWVVNGYALVFASLMLGFGALSDRAGRKRVMLGGVVVFCAGSVLGALSPNVTVLIGARALMGVGAAASEPGTLSVIRHLYPERRSRARALGVWAAVSGLALALGPVIGGILVGLGSWRNVFWFNLAAGALALVAGVVTIPESRVAEPGRADVVGDILIAVALGSLIFAVIDGETAGYRSPWIVALFVASAIAAVSFVGVERRSRAPTLDLRYLREPAFTGALVVAFTVYFAIFSIFFFVALYLVEVVGYGGFRIAAQFAPMTITMVLASLFAGRWVARTGPRAPMTVGCLAAGVGVLLTEVALRGNVSTVGLATSLALSGLGFGITVVPVTSVALGVVPAERSGMAASATNTSRELGSVMGVAVLGSMVNGFLTHGLSARLAHLGVPAAFRQLVIDAIERGEVPSQAGLSTYQATYGPVVTKVVEAAYGAFHEGLNVALIVSGVAILVSAAASWATLAPSDPAVAQLAFGGSNASPAMGAPGGPSGG